MQEKIREYINTALDDLKIESADFSIEYPNETKFGDLSTNIAMVLAKSLNENPESLAKKIIDNINTKNYPDIKIAEIAGPGFINFFLSDEYLLNNIKSINDQDVNYGKNKQLDGQTVIIDHTDPNPFKQFHIGHLMSNAIGESISRIYEYNGAKVIRYCYQGDVGPHVAKTIWGMKQMTEAFPHDGDSLHDKLNFLGQAYTLGSNRFEEDEVVKAEVKEINKKIFELYDFNKANDDLDLQVYYEKGKQWSLLHFDEIYSVLNVNFVRSIFESEIFEMGQKIVNDNIPEVFSLSDGAIIYEGEKDGLHTRVFVNSQGLPTYEAKELGLSFFKKQLAKNYDKSIVITAVEQKEYFKVVMAALQKIDSEMANKTEHITHGMMRFQDGKMSSRKGNIITGESLILDLREKIFEKIADKDYDQNLKDEISINASVAAIKFSILKQSPGKDIIFDIEKAVSFDGDSGPYIQYTYARGKSILEKAAEQGVRYSEYSLPIDWKLTGLEKNLYKFPDLVARSLEEKSPQIIANYLIKLATEFNSFYEQNKILDDVETMAYKLTLTKSVMIVLRNGLNLLGIKTPEKM